MITDAGFTSLNEEINKILDLISNSNSLNIEEWNHLNTELLRFIDNIVANIATFCNSPYNKIASSDKRYDDRKNESIALLKQHIDAQKKLIYDKKRKIVWDILKMVISAIIGGAVALMFNRIF